MEKYAFESDDVVAPTVIASAAEAGDLVHASEASLPAATTTETPPRWARLMASFMVCDLPPPSERESTDGRPDATACCFAHSTPAMTPV